MVGGFGCVTSNPPTRFRLVRSAVECHVAQRKGLSVILPTIDLILIVVFMTASMAVGIGLGRKQSSLEDFALGGRNLPWWALLGSIVATETSTATFLGVTGRPAFGDGDMRFLQLALGYIIGRVAVSVILLPQYFRGQLYTAYEVLNQRFGGTAQRAASLLFIVTRNLGDGLRLYLCAVALEFAIGVRLPICVLIIGVVTVIYTVCGGMKSVVWNDCIQFVIYVIGGIAALFVIVNALPGGWDELMAFAREKESLRVFVASPPDGQSWATWLRMDGYAMYAAILGGAVLTFGTHGVDQMMVQRYLCAKSQADATRAVIGSGFIVLGQFALFLFVGVAVHCFIQHVPPPESAATKDRIFSWFIVEHMPVGLTGITLAAVFAAAMSTLSSSLSSSATAAVADFASRDTSTGVGRTRLWIGIFGLVQIAIALAASRLSQNVVDEALAIAGFTAGVLLGVFLLGTFSKKANERAALVGMLAGVLVVGTVHLTRSTSGIWYSLIGSVVTFGTGIIVAKIGSDHVSQ